MQGRLLYSPMRNSCAARTAVFSVTAHICCVSGHGLRNHPARVSLGGDLGGNAQEEIAYVSANGTRRPVLCRYIAALRRRRRPCCCKSCLNIPRKCHAARMGHARSSSICRKKAGRGRKWGGSSERRRHSSACRPRPDKFARRSDELSCGLCILPFTHPHPFANFSSAVFFLPSLARLQRRHQTRVAAACALKRQMSHATYQSDEIVKSNKTAVMNFLRIPHKCQRESAADPMAMLVLYGVKHFTFLKFSLLEFEFRRWKCGMSRTRPLLTKDKKCINTGFHIKLFNYLRKLQF